MMTRRWITAAPLVLALALTACAGEATTADSEAAHDGHGQSSTVVAGAREIAVRARSFAFEPGELRIKAGEDVTIVLTSADVLHDFTVHGTDAHVVAGPGETAKGGLRIDQPGTYEIVCTEPGHEAAGMRATLVVEAT